MKKIFTAVTAALLILASVFTVTGCQKKGLTVAIPNDTTNEARALLLLEKEGFITLKADAGITATVKDIAENPYGLEFKEMEAAQLPRILSEVDYAVINSNYAISAGINPVADSLCIEGSSSYYSNIIAVKSGNENTDKIKALVAACQSEAVKDFLDSEYEGSIVSTVDVLTDGYDASVDYEALAGETITVAASPTPHALILAIAKDILAEKDITLEIVEFEDYVQPNNVVDAGEMDANYFQHLPYLEDFNQQHGTDIVSAAAIHVEPMGLYGGQKDSLDAITGK